MEEQKYTSRVSPLHREPGRRYAAGRVRPRAGADVRGGPRPLVTTHPAPKTVLQVSHNQRQAISADVKPARIPKERPESHLKPALPRQKRSLVLKRQMVERAAEHKKKTKSTHKRRFLGFISFTVVAVAFLVVCWSFWDLVPISSLISKAEKRLPTPTVMAPQQESSSLDENAPSVEEIREYQTTSDAPRVLRIPKLDVQTRVKRVGASLNGEPISPNNIFDAGWFDDSAKPGLPGVVLINGHTGGQTKDGIFSDLASLVANDLLLIERGDGINLTYKVVKVQAYPADQVDMTAALQSVDANKNGLNLMTSAIRYDGRSSKAEQRIVVFAVQQ